MLWIYSSISYELDTKTRLQWLCEGWGAKSWQTGVDVAQMRKNDATPRGILASPNHVILNLVAGNTSARKT